MRIAGYKYTEIPINSDFLIRQENDLARYWLKKVVQASCLQQTQAGSLCYIGMMHQNVPNHFPKIYPIYRTGSGSLRLGINAFNPRARDGRDVEHIELQFDRHVSIEVTVFHAENVVSKLSLIPYIHTIYYSSDCIAFSCQLSVKETFMLYKNILVEYKAKPLYPEVYLDQSLEKYIISYYKLWNKGWLKPSKLVPKKPRAAPTHRSRH